jgi:hypothetical protein
MAVAMSPSEGEKTIASEMGVTSTPTEDYMIDAGFRGMHEYNHMREDIAPQLPTTRTLTAAL